MPTLRLLCATLLSTTLTLGLSLTTEASIPERSEVPEQYKWDLSDMYVDGDAWARDKERFDALLPTIVQYKGRLAESGNVLLEAIKAQEALSMLIGDLYVYAGLRSFEDTRISDNAARFSEAQTLLARYNEAMAFFTPELLALSEDVLDTMIASTPGLEIYRHYLDEQARMRPYTLSPEEERLLALAGDPLGKFGSVFNAIDNADLKLDRIQDETGEWVELSKARYGAYVFSENRQVREQAWKALHSAYQALNHTLAANYEGHVKAQVFEAKARGFTSALEAATFVNGIPVEVYSNLISAAREGAAPLQRYVRIRQEALGLETLQVWDLYAPIVEPTIDKVPFEEAKKIVAEALTPLGDDYLEVYWKGFDEGWVDAFENQGKRGGAYSWGTYTSKPYLSMNYEGTLGDISTLAHEYGHSIHSYLARSTQPYAYGDYRIFIAEIASMTNEAILMQKMLKEASSPQEKAYLLQAYLDEFRSGFYRQATFADFEMQAHEVVERGEALTAETLNNLYAEVFKTYYGDALTIDPLNDVEWSRIPHFLRSDNFYVYQYSTSFVAATALAKLILEEGEPARDRFLDMLRAGSSDDPISLLKKAGIDMTTAKPIYDTIEVFDSLVTELENTLSVL